MIPQVLDLGFILTMWYVNIVAFVKQLEDNSSFILTMWYVNIIPILKDEADTSVLY